MLRVLLASASLFALAFAHTNLICTSFKADAGANACPQDGAYPYHPAYTKGGLVSYEHKEPSKLCRGDLWSGGGLDSAPGTSLPIVEAGSTQTIVWTSNGHSLYASDEGEKAFNTGRFAYIWHSPLEDPNDALFSTTPYAQFDWHNCGPNEQGIATPGGSATPDTICKGNLTISTQLSEGIHTFVFGWNWGGHPGDTLFNYNTCFQYQVKNAGGGSIKPTGSLPSTKWTPVYFPDPSFSPMTGLMQTLNAEAAVIKRKNGQSYGAFWREYADAVAAVPEPQKVSTSATSSTTATLIPSPSASSSSAGMRRDIIAIGAGQLVGKKVMMKRHRRAAASHQ